MEQVFQFLKELKEHNNREWMQDHREIFIWNVRRRLLS